MSFFLKKKINKMTLSLVFRVSLMMRNGSTRQMNWQSKRSKKKSNSITPYPFLNCNSEASEGRRGEMKEKKEAAQK